MSEQVDQEIERITALSQSNDLDKKVAALNQLQTLLSASETSKDITPAQADSITELLKPLLKASNQLVSTHALAALSPFLSLLTLQEHSNNNEEHVPPHIRHAILSLLPVDKLVDSKERVRESARTALVKAGLLAFHYGGSAANTVNVSSGKERETPWNHYLKVIETGAFGSKNAKAREQALHILTALRSSTPCPPLRPFTPHLLPLLSDSDGAVRSLALSTTITIFSNTTVSNAARIDLKKELVKREKDIGKKVVDMVMNGVMGGSPVLGTGLERRGSESAFSDKSVSSAPPRTQNTSSSTPPPKATRPGATTSPSLPALPSAAFPSDPSAIHTPTTTVTPIYITSPVDLANSINKRKPCFEGKETEFNWIERDKSVGVLRGILAAIEEGKEKGCYTRDEFLTELKGVQDGVLKTSSSLRTTLAVSTLSFISDLASILGHSFDHYSEPYLTHTLSMAGQTKKIVATASQATVTSILNHTSYHLRILHLLISTFSLSKIAQARTFLSLHISNYIEKYGHLIQQHGGVDDIIAIFKKGLADAVPAVRENFRDGFMTFSAIWPEKREAILGGLDPSVRKQLEKVLVGRVHPSASSKASTVAPTPIVAEKKKPVARMSVKEMMKAKKEALAAESAAGDPVINPASDLPAPPPVVGSTSPKTTTPTSPKPRPLSTSSIPSPARHHPPTPRAADQASSTTTNSDHHTPIMSRTIGKAPVLPVADKIVDAALQGQAQQAEQAAERLLEVGDDLEGKSRMPANGMATQTPKNRLGTLGGKNFESVFQDSPVGKNGLIGANSGKNNWWSQKVTTALSPRKPATPEREAEIVTLISSIQHNQTSTKDLKALTSLSKERPVRDTGGNEEEFEGDSEFWAKDKNFTRVWSGLQNLLNGLTAAAVKSDFRMELQKESALTLLKALVENQFPCFAGEEAQLFALLFWLRDEEERTTVAAVDSVAQDICDQSEPLYGLGTLRSSLQTHLQQSRLPQSHAYLLGLRLVRQFFGRLEEDVMEEELPKVKSLIKNALDDDWGELRRASMEALVAAHTVLHDEERLYLLVDGLGGDQKNLLSYYIAKLRAESQ